MRITYLWLVILIIRRVYMLENNITVKGTYQHKDVNFVESIKKTLRRNNDDYTEINAEEVNKLNSNQTKPVQNGNDNNYINSVQTQTSKLKDGRRNNQEPNMDNANQIKVISGNYNSGNNINEDRRSIKPEIQHSKKMNMLLPEFNSSLFQNKSLSNLLKYPLRHIVRNQKLLDNQPRKLHLTTQITRISSMLPIIPVIKKRHSETYATSITPKGQPLAKKIFIDRIQGLKNFMKKNKGLVKEYMRKKQASNKLTTNNMPLKSKNLEGIAQRVHDKSKEVARIGGIHHAELPKEQMLDMAPAKGGLVHVLRLKNRLCHRHVLMPEGPKYDSKGRWYLPAHEFVLKRPYNATRRPGLLLPRCCNCCKKSVLGCE